MAETKPKPNARKSLLKLKGEQLPQKKLENAGDIVSGVFLGYKVIMLDDMDSPNGQKPVRYYEFHEEGNEDAQFVVSGKLMLDQAFDTAVRKMKGIDKLQGKFLEFSRQADTKLDAKRSLGNYMIEIFES